jgi:ABC-type antimicrobial peptide transport system permease subunit
MTNGEYGPVFTVNNQAFRNDESAWIDPSWLHFFKYNFIAGTAAAFAANPFSVVITASTAKKYFGQTDPTSKLIRVDTVNYTIAGIVADNPSNSSFQFSILLNIEGLKANANARKNFLSWNNYTCNTFVRLAPAVSPTATAKAMAHLVDEKRILHNTDVSLTGLKDIYFDNELEASRLPSGDKKAVYVFSLLGILLLITGCVNYINLTTARASTRAKEMAIRKIAGAGRFQLFLQLMAESLAMSLLAMLLTLVLSGLLLPLFNSITNRHFTLSSAPVWHVAALTVLLVTLLNGIYPALMLSSFKPVPSLKGKSILHFKDTNIRRVLVVFQFSLATALIFGTIVIFRQLSYMQQMQKGYSAEQVISFPVSWRVYIKMNDEARKNFFLSIRKELSAEPGVRAVSCAGDEIINVRNWSTGNADWDGRDSSFNPKVTSLETDEYFAEMFQLKMASGRWFEQGGADKHNYILNETAVRTFGMKQPILGQRFSFGGDTGIVIGITKDFFYKSMHEKLGALVLRYEPSGNFYVKIAPGRTRDILERTETLWKRYMPGQPYEYHFLDESFARLYERDIKTSRLVLLFSLTVVVISAMGLFGLAVFAAERRTREIGIRKVLGASVAQLVTLLSKEFFWLIAIAVLIALPLAGWLTQHWLQDFAYHVTVGGGIFLATALIVMLIAWLSVGIQSWRAGSANPVENLRSE